MGSTTYNYSARSVRADDLGYTSTTLHNMSKTFTQMDKREVHELMSPKGLTKRECCDSDVHPNTVPIIVALDLTGSMGSIPVELIKDGLPKLMSKLIQAGVPDASLLFMGVGDHEYDRAPLQVGQFESGDEELDLWLTRTYPEGGGGSNGGESYLLAWYTAAFHTKTDAFDKRNKKGFLFTIGDEPGLRSLPQRSINELIGNNVSQKSWTDIELLEEAQKMYNVFHIHVMHSTGAGRSLGYWKQLLGQNCLEAKQASNVAELISNTVLQNTEGQSSEYYTTSQTNITESQIIL